MKNICYLVLFFVLQAVTAYAQNDVDREKPIYFEFQTINEDIFFESFQRQVDFYELFQKKTSEGYPKNSYDKCFLLEVYLRAGLPDKAQKALEDIVANYPNLKTSTANNLYAKISKFSYPKLSTIVIDSYGHIIVGERTNCYYSGFDRYRCINCRDFFYDLRSKEKWSMSKIEDWIQRNTGIPEIDKPFLRMSLFIHFKSKRKVRKFTKELANKMYQRRDDIDKLIEYLQLMNMVGYKRLSSYGIDLS